GNRQRRLHRQAAKRRCVGARREVEAGVPALRDRAGVVGGKALNGLGRGVETALFESLGAQRSDRRGGLGVGAAEQCAGDEDDVFVVFLDFLARDRGGGGGSVLSERR